MINTFITFGYRDRSGSSYLSFLIILEALGIEFLKNLFRRIILSNLAVKVETDHVGSRDFGGKLEVLEIPFAPLTVTQVFLLQKLSPETRLDMSGLAISRSTGARFFTE